MDGNDFKAEKISKTASFIVNSNIDAVFPLFGAFEERKWEPSWNPELIYPSEEIIEEGTTFKTEGRGEEQEFLWRVSKYYVDQSLIQYLVSTQNRYWTITVICNELNDNSTNVSVTYTYIGLNNKGNKLNRAHIELIYENNLKDWAHAINGYLKSSK